jgi:hypothetical protein
MAMPAEARISCDICCKAHLAEIKREAFISQIMITLFKIGSAKLK